MWQRRLLASSSCYKTFSLCITNTLLTFWALNHQLLLYFLENDKCKWHLSLFSCLCFKELSVCNVFSWFSSKSSRSILFCLLFFLFFYVKFRRTVTLLLMKLSHQITNWTRMNFPAMPFLHTLLIMTIYN